MVVGGWVDAKADRSNGLSEIAGVIEWDDTWTSRRRCAVAIPFGKNNAEPAQMVRAGGH